MELAHFDRLFDNHILERGMIYAQDKVHHFMDDGHTISAIVYGQSHYHVEVKTDGTKIISMSCDCPYAKEGHACKHQAAVLYYQRDVSLAKRQEKLQNDIDIVFKQSSLEDLSAFFKQALLDDERLYAQFEKRFIKRLTREDLRLAQSALERIIMRYETDDRVDRLVMECEAFFDTHVRQMISEGYDNEAFTLMSMMIDELSRHTPLLVMKYAGSLKVSLFDALHVIVARSSGLVETRMYRYVSGYFGHDSWVEKEMTTLFYEQFPSFAKEKADVIRPQVLACLTSSYDLEEKRTQIDVYLKLLKQTNQEDVLKAFCEEHFNDFCVRQAYGNYLKAEGEGSVYQTLLEEMLQKAPSNAQQRDIAYELRDLYQKDDPKRYAGILRDILIQYDPCDFQTYQVYKALLGEEAWRQERPLLLAKLSYYRGIDKIYAAEGMMDELVCYLSEHPSTTLLQTYADVVKAYPELLLRQFEERIETMALTVSDRPTYRQIALMIRQMRQVEGGDKRADRLLARLRNTYKNRTAMMAELRKV